MFYLPDTQEAIVSQAQFDRVQELRKNKRRPAKAERQGLFSGLLFCADCGGKLHFATSKSFEGKQDSVLLIFGTVIVSKALAYVECIAPRLLSYKNQ